MPTIFDDRGELDLDGQRRCLDFMIDAGSHGICILANFSEQFVLTDAEREQVMDAVISMSPAGSCHRDDDPFQLVNLCRAQPSGPAGRRRHGDDHAALSRCDLPVSKGIFDFYCVVSDAIDIPT